MHIGRPIDVTFKSHLQNVYYVNDRIDEVEMIQLLKKFEQMGTAMNYAVPLLFIIDYTKAEYMLMTHAARLITDRDPREFLESGIPLLIDVFQKDDFKIYNERVFAANTLFLKEQPKEDHHKFIFSYNFRVRHRNGKFVPLLQRGCYVTSKETGLPLYSLGMVMDIAAFKKDRLIYHTIEKTEETNGVITKNLMVSNCFFPYEEDRMLSRHELNILEQMAAGRSSKQIAWKMRITENTVANHRKNMLKKTNTKNVAELVAFACKSGLI